MIKLLIVDDEEGFRRAIAQSLARQGFEVLEAAEGTEGLRVASQSRPDLILCDVEMPGLDGYGVLAALRRAPELADIPVILLTGQSEPAQVRQGMNLGADDYLTKPVSLSDLTGAIRARLQRRQPEREKREQQAPSKEDNSFLVKTSTEKRLVKISEIRSILAYGEYSWVYWDNSQKGALLRKSLKQWMSELPAERFIRVHRRAIVNLAFMERVETLPGGRMQIYLHGIAEPIPVSLRLAPALNRKLRTLRG
jgi:DNA-binding response OmpR family regulator